MEDNITKMKKWFRSNMTWVYFTIAILFILFPNTPYSPFSTKWNNLLEKIGFIGMTSGIFASVLKSIQFTGLFQEELSKVISGSEFLKNRKDLPELWKKISKSIYQEKFPEISNLLENLILTTYFPVNAKHYNEDVIVSICIHEISDDSIIKYTQTIEYNAILDSKHSESIIKHINVPKKNEEINELISFKIDGVEKKDTNIKEEIKENGVDKTIYKVPVKGKNKFEIFQKTKSEYSLKGNNVKTLRFNSITKNIDLTVSYPDYIEVSFFNIGVIDDFKHIHTGFKNSLSRRHRNGLVLPRQGFGLSFNKKSI